MALVYKLSYFCQFGAISCVSVLLPVFLQSIGLTEEKIGILCSLRPYLMSLASPMWSAIADTFHLHAFILLSSIVLSAAVRFFYLTTTSFPALVLWFSLASVFDSAISPIFDTFAMNQLNDVTDWGKIRLWGAIGFGLSSLGAGFIVTQTTLEWAGVFILYWFLMALTFFSMVNVVARGNRNNGSAAVVQAIDEGGEEAGPNNKYHQKSRENDDGKEILVNENGRDQSSYDMRPLESLEPTVEKNSQRNHTCSESDDQRMSMPAPAPHGESAGLSGDWALEITSSEKDSNNMDSNKAAGQWKEMIQLCCSSELLSFFCVILVGGMSAGVIDTFLYLHLRSLGGSALLCGAARAATCAAEVPVFQLADRLLRRAGEEGTIALALAVYVARLGCYAGLHRLGRPALVLPAEALHGFTFAALWAASTSYAYRVAPPRLRTTMQGLVTGIHWGVGFGSGALAGGWAYRRRGAVWLFQAQAALVGAVLALYLPLLLLRRRRRRSPPAGGGEAREEEGGGGGGAAAAVEGVRWLEGWCWCWGALPGWWGTSNEGRLRLHRKLSRRFSFSPCSAGWQRKRPSAGLAAAVDGGGGWGDNKDGGGVQAAFFCGKQ